MGSFSNYLLLHLKFKRHTTLGKRAWNHVVHFSSRYFLVWDDFRHVSESRPHVFAISSWWRFWWHIRNNKLWSEGGSPNDRTCFCYDGGHWDPDSDSDILSVVVAVAVAVAFIIDIADNDTESIARPRHYDSYITLREMEMLGEFVSYLPCVEPPGEERFDCLCCIWRWCTPRLGEMRLQLCGNRLLRSVTRGT